MRSVAPESIREDKRYYTHHNGKVHAIYVEDILIRKATVVSIRGNRRFQVPVEQIFYTDKQAFDHMKKSKRTRR